MMLVVVEAARHGSVKTRVQSTLLRRGHRESRGGGRRGGLSQDVNCGGSEGELERAHDGGVLLVVVGAVMVAVVVLCSHCDQW